MIKIGTNKREAIDWIQDALGPVTPRNIAEDTVNALLQEGLIETAIDEVVLVEALNQDDLRRRARNTIVKQASRGDRRRMPRTAPGQQTRRSDGVGHHHRAGSGSGGGPQQSHHHMNSHENVVQQGDSTILVVAPDQNTTPTTK